MLVISFSCFSDITIEDCKSQMKLDEESCRLFSSDGENKSYCWQQVYERYSYCKRNLELGWSLLYKILYKY